MYSQDEINSAIAAGVLSEDAALDLRAHITQMRERPVTDEEHFRLVSSFNDIFVAIGVVIMLFAVGAIGQAIGRAIVPASTGNWESYARRESAEFAIGAVLVATTAWFLAEFFTRKRRMALPSIVLLITFVAGAFVTVIGAGNLATSHIDNYQARDAAMFAVIAIAALVAVGAAGLHWRRFAVPIAIAAGAAAIAVFVLSIIVGIIDNSSDLDNENVLFAAVFIAGLTIFAYAMRWDFSDRTRQTRRADVAFWLHLLAAPMIAHPVFYALGVTDGDTIGIVGVIGVLSVYVAFGLIALAIDRRALLVSALAYVLIALTIVFDRFGAVELSVALTALIIGSALLTLSAFWSRSATWWSRHFPVICKEGFP